MYYLIGSADIGLASTEQLDGDSTKLWHRGLRGVGLKSDQTLEGASICHLESCDSCVLDKKKVKFNSITHYLYGLLDCVHMDVWGHTKTASLRGHQYCLYCR